MKKNGDHIPKWRVDSEKEVLRYPIFSLHEMQSVSGRDTQKTGTFVYLNCPDWVNVIAITPDKKVVFVEQYRHGIREITKEIPGGLCDPGEDPLTTGVRELAEETGYVGKNPRLIGTVQPNPAYQNNRCHTIVVHEAQCIQEQSLDEHEEIEICLLTMDEVRTGIRDGRIQNAMVVAAFHFFSLHFGNSSDHTIY